MLEKQTIKNYDITPIIIAALLFVIMMGSFAGIAEASSHQEVVDIDDNSYTQVEYEDNVSVNDTTLPVDTGFVIEDSGGNIIAQDEIIRDNGTGFVAPTTSPSDNLTILSHSERLNFSTSVFDSVVTGDTLVDPRGDYTVRNAISGTLTVSDQTPASGSGNGEIVIDEVQANVPYYIGVLDIASGSEIGGEVGFDAGEGYTDFGLQLNGSNTVSDGDNLEIALIDARTDEILVEETIDTSGTYGTSGTLNDSVTIDSGASTLTVSNTTNNMNSYNYNFEVISKYGQTASGEPRQYKFRTEKESLDEFNDSIIINDAISEVEGKTGVYFGQKLILGLNEVEVDDSADYRIRRVDEEDGTALSESVDRTVEDNNISVNERMIQVNTNDLGGEDVQIADYELREDGDAIFNFSVNTQSIDSSANDSFVNLETSDDTANINITSDRIGFDVLVTSDQFNASELMSVIDQSSLQANGSEVSIENEENDSVRITDMVGGDLKDQIPLDFSGRDAGEYGFVIESVDTGVETSTTFEVDYGPSGQADFDKGTYRQQQGDKINMTISLSETNTATFSIKDDDYSPPGQDSLDIGIEDTDGSDSVTITFDTYIADETNNTSLDFEDIFTIHNGEFTSTPANLPNVAGRLSTGIYDMQLDVNSRKVDQSVINLVPRETEEVNTWVLPSTEITGGPEVEDISDLGTKKETIANGDWLVFEVKASGIYNSRMMNNNTKPSELVNYDERDDLTGPADIGPDAERMPELHMEIEGERPAPNEDEPRLLMEKADNIQVAPENDTFYAFFETSNTNNYEMFAPGFTVDETEDIWTNYTASLNFTEKYKLVDEENNSADMNKSYEIVERKVDTNMTQVITNEEGLSSRFGIRAINNSTVKGDTHIAPGSEFTLYVSSTEGADTIYEQRDVTVEEKNNSTMGEVSSQFDFADAEIGRNMSIQFSPMNPEQNATIVEPDQPPSIESINVNSPVSAGEEVTFSPVINNSNPSTLTYEWDFDYNNSTSSAPEPTYIYDENGTYNVSLTVEDPKNRTDSAEVNVVVEQRPNNPPVIRSTIVDEQLDVGETGDFAAVATDDTSTEAIIYNWDFGDGNNATGVSTTHSYQTQGVYNVTVTATDEDGAQDSETIRVEVEGDGTVEGAEFDVTVNTVNASSGDPVPSADITVLDTDSNPVAQATTNTSGGATVSVPNGEYEVSANADGYSRTSEPGLQVNGSDVDSFEVPLDPSDDGSSDTNNSTDDGGEDPDQPGFTLLFGAVALAAAGGLVYRRREGQHSVDKI